MKLFKSLLIAPATIGLLAPFTAFAGEANVDEISKYSNLEGIELSNLFLRIEIPQGFACFTIAVPIFFGRVFDISKAEKISL